MALQSSGAEEKVALLQSQMALISLEASGKARLVRRFAGWKRLYMELRGQGCELILSSRGILCAAGEYWNVSLAAPYFLSLTRD